MNKIVEYLFEGFLIMVFCVAIKTWFVGNENIDSLIDLTKRTIEADGEIINTSHITLNDKYQAYLAVVPFDEEYDMQSMKEFIKTGNTILVSFNGTQFYQAFGEVNVAAYSYIKVDGRLYKKDGNKFIKK